MHPPLGHAPFPPEPGRRGHPCEEEITIGRRASPQTIHIHMGNRRPRALDLKMLRWCSGTLCWVTWPPPSNDEFVGLGTWDLHSQHQKTPAQGPRPTILTRRTSQDLRAGPLHNECHSGGWGGADARKKLYGLALVRLRAATGSEIPESNSTFARRKHGEELRDAVKRSGLPL